MLVEIGVIFSGTDKQNRCGWFFLFAQSVQERSPQKVITTKSFQNGKPFWEVSEKTYIAFFVRTITPKNNNDFCAHRFFLSHFFLSHFIPALYRQRKQQSPLCSRSEPGT
jgi:hypothetical protein